MRILYLTLKAHWYDMIEAGIKTEEYREIKKFWVKRLCEENKGSLGGLFMDAHKVIAYTAKDFTHVHFARGGHFGNKIPQMTLELKGIEVGTGKQEWGAEPNKDYFVIKLK
jgi:hypothetical protein